MARDERADLLDLLTSLSPEQWDAPTLCEAWRVRDVVAHMFSYDELSTPALMQRFARGWFVLNRVNAVGVTEYTRRTPDELLALVRANLEPSGLPGYFGGLVALIDGMIHQQDIRRSLGIPRDIPPERLQAALRYALRAPAVRGAWRARGLRLVATDLERGVVGEALPTRPPGPTGPAANRAGRRSPTTPSPGRCNTTEVRPDPDPTVS